METLFAFFNIVCVLYYLYKYINKFEDGIAKW